MNQLLTDTEAIVHQQVCGYLRMRYPKIIFNSDGAGNNLSRAQAGMSAMLRSSAGFPDLFVAAARTVVIGGSQVPYHGLFIELKREGTRLYKKNGSWAGDHIEQQAGVLEALRQAGYCALFCLGFDEAKSVIDEYLAG